MNKPEAGLRTARLLLRHLAERDRDRFVQLFCDEGFMVFSECGPLSPTAASRRFDRLLLLAEELPFCRHAVIELGSGEIVGYVGAEYIDYRGERRVEFGYRLVEMARGRGFATEAGRAILHLARQTYWGELLAFVDPLNEPSHNVLRKLGFGFVEMGESNAHVSAVYKLIL